MPTSIFVHAIISSMENKRSRIHPLRSYPVGFYIKRDDELSFGVSGSKWRKMLSLIPALQAKGVKQALLIGGAHSNNVLALGQRLREVGIRPIGILLEPHDKSLKGNFLLSSLFLSEIHWIPREAWHDVGAIAAKLAPEGSLIIPEGADMAEAYLGAQTLARDIERNEAELGQRFAHIFLDSGTGLTARACIEGMKDSPAEFHVVTMAPSQLPVRPNVHAYRPRLRASFGAVSPQIFSFIRDFAAREGVLLDPLYSAKLFYEAEHIAKEKELKGPALIVHSGGALSLMGFSDQLARAIGRSDASNLI
jgi:1-aminocyclopropane-1-carboxylate deaminase